MSGRREPPRRDARPRLPAGSLGTCDRFGPTVSSRLFSGSSRLPPRPSATAATTRQPGDCSRSSRCGLSRSGSCSGASPWGARGCRVLAFASLACWIAVSSVWGIPERGILEAERIALYVTALAAACVVLTRRALRAHYAGCGPRSPSRAVTGCSRVSSRTLGVFDPLGGSGSPSRWVTGTVSACLRLSDAARRRPRSRGLDEGSAVRRGIAAPALIDALLHLQPGRRIALAAGLFAAIALDQAATPARDERAAFAPGRDGHTVARVPILGAQPFGASSADAARAGSSLAIVVGVGGGLRACHVRRCSSWSDARAHPRLQRGMRRVSLPRASRRSFVVFVRFGSPPTLVSRTYDAFAAPPPALHGRERRLFNLSGSGRLVQWRVAWRAYEHEPVLGSGAGTYEQSWNELRPTPYKVRDAHSLYLETLAEVGPVGLGLLLARSIPVLWPRSRARRPPGLGHVRRVHGVRRPCGRRLGLELPAVTSSDCFAQQRCSSPHGANAPAAVGPRSVGSWSRSLSVAAFSVVGLVGNRALADGEAALNAGRATLAADRARAASRWAPGRRRPIGCSRRRSSRAEIRGCSRESAAGDRRRSHAIGRCGSRSPRRHPARRGAHALAEARRLNPRSPEIASFVSANGQR